jgi:hypothetical protein
VRHIAVLFCVFSTLAAPAGAQERSTSDAPPPAVRFSGYVQTDWVAFRQSSQDEVSGATGDPLNQDRFTLRRGRIRADAERGIALGTLEIDANTVNGPIVRPIDVEASARWPPRGDGVAYVMATVGLFKIPFGFELLENETVRPFLERSTAIGALFPGGHDLGARLKARWRFLDASVAVMNGDPIGERQFPGRDPNKSKDVVLRLASQTALRDTVRVEWGVSGLTGTGLHKGTPSTKDVLVWRDVNQDGIVQPTEVQAIPGSAATPSRNFHRFAVGAHLHVAIRIPVLGDLDLRGEIIRASNLDRGLRIADPISTERDVRETGFCLGFSQQVTRYAFAGIRYDRYDPDADANEQRGVALVPSDNGMSTLSLAGGLRYGDGTAARLFGQYDHNTNALGRTAGGLPTTLADDAFTLRAEVAF